PQRGRRPRHGPDRSRAVRLRARREWPPLRPLYRRRPRPPLPQFEPPSLTGFGSTDSPTLWPRRMGPWPLGGPSECWGVKNHTILFEDGGRYFQAQVVFGPDAPATL